MTGRALVVLLCLAAAAHADPASRDYIVRPGDSCVSIADHELGDRMRYVDIHALNPGLGKLPHHLVPGSILRLPARVATTPDATLTRARGAVRVRAPEVETWNPAAAGMDLFRAWRVHAQARSSAEVTFRDASRLVMREDTIVIIFGPSAPVAAAPRTEAVLETGGLESRLDAASRRSLVVHTPSSEAELGAGHALVTVDPAGTSRIANHGGAPVALRGVDGQRRPVGRRVAVAQNMGSKVAPQQPPTAPRPLPPAPSWTTGPSRFVDLGAGATVTMQWTQIASAAHYRVEIVTTAGVELTSAEVGAGVTAFEAHRLAPGAYVAHVSTIDGDRFESVRSLDRAFDIVAVDVLPPAAPPAVPAADADLTTPVPPRVVAAGSRLVAPSGMTCGLGDAAPTAALTFTGAGDTELRCVAADGSAIAAVAITVAAAPPPPAPPPVPPPIAAPTRPARRPQLELGAFAGFHLYRTDPRAGSALGDPTTPSTIVAPGPALGVHLAWWIWPGLGVEAEASLVAGGWAGRVGRAVIATWRAHADLLLAEHRGIAAHFLLGLGSDSLLDPVAGSRRDSELVFDRGLRITLDAGGGLRTWLELRDDLQPSLAGGRADVLGLHAGVLRRF